MGRGARRMPTVDGRFRCTRREDGGRGGRPIVWPAASMQQDERGLSPTRVKAVNRALIDAGLITMKDSPNGKRRTRRPFFCCFEIKNNRVPEESA